MVENPSKRAKSETKLFTWDKQKQKAKHIKRK